MKYNIARFNRDAKELAHEITTRGHKYTSLVPIPQGGTVLATALSALTRIPLLELKDFKGMTPQQQASCILVDDVIDSGTTLEKLPIPGLIVVLFMKDYEPGTTYDDDDGPQCEVIAVNQLTEWVDFWWEGDAADKGSITDNITRILQHIGEDVTREGLIETPKRIAKSYTKLFEGYKMNPLDVMKTFEDDTCDELVLLKNVEFFSTCEHHMIPFHGRCHIAYLPNGKVLGVSKLARLFDIFARRMQIQERIGQQVTTILMEELGAKGAACIIEAQHMCMTARGVEKQNSVMVTSSMEGVFRENGQARNELMQLIQM